MNNADVFQPLQHVMLPWPYRHTLLTAMFHLCFSITVAVALQKLNVAAEPFKCFDDRSSSNQGFQDNKMPQDVGK